MYTYIVCVVLNDWYENKKLQPLRDKKIENLSKLQKINLEISNLNQEEKRVKDLNIKLQNNILLIDSDLEREKSIYLDADLNEKRISKEKDELLKTENELLEVEASSSKELKHSKAQLDSLQSKLDAYACYKKEVRPGDHPRSLDSLKTLSSSL